MGFFKWQIQSADMHLWIEGLGFSIGWLSAGYIRDNIIALTVINIIKTNSIFIGFFIFFIHFYFC